MHMKSITRAFLKLWESRVSAGKSAEKSNRSDAKDVFEAEAYLGTF